MLTPQARSGLGKVSDHPSCVQFRNRDPFLFESIRRNFGHCTSTVRAGAEEGQQLMLSQSPSQPDAVSGPSAPFFSLESCCRQWARSSSSTRRTSHSRGGTPTVCAALVSSNSLSRSRDSRGLMVLSMLRPLLLPFAFWPLQELGGRFCVQLSDLHVVQDPGRPPSPERPWLDLPSPIRSTARLEAAAP